MSEQVSVTCLPVHDHYGHQRLCLSNAYASLPAVLAPLDPPNKPATAPHVSSKHDSYYRLKVARWRQAKMAKQLKKLSEDEFFDTTITMALREGWQPILSRKL